MAARGAAVDGQTDSPAAVADDGAGSGADGAALRGGRQTSRGSGGPALDAADAVDRRPGPRAGEAVLTPGGQPFTGDDDALGAALENRGVRFHPGWLGGALPRIKR